MISLSFLSIYRRLLYIYIKNTYGNLSLMQRYYLYKLFIYGNTIIATYHVFGFNLVKFTFKTISSRPEVHTTHTGYISECANVLVESSQVWRTHAEFLCLPLFQILHSFAKEQLLGFDWLWLLSTRKIGFKLLFKGTRATSLYAATTHLHQYLNTIKHLCMNLPTLC